MDRWPFKDSMQAEVIVFSTKRQHCAEVIEIPGVRCLLPISFKRPDHRQVRGREKTGISESDQTASRGEIVYNFI